MSQNMCSSIHQSARGSNNGQQKMTRNQPLLALLALLAGAACAAPSILPSATTVTDSTDALHERGRRIYNFRCYYCHGYSGDAHTLAATYMARKPGDFTALNPDTTSAESLRETIAHGRAGTAMQGFGSILSAQDIRAVSDFVRTEFVTNKAQNTRYHTTQNGWGGHERYRSAFPFATGAIALDRNVAELSVDEQQGRAVFMRACISCHDRGRVTTPVATWTAVANNTRDEEHEEYRPLPSAGVNPATPHDYPPRLGKLTTIERRGEQIYQANCALCHAADGTGKNWMGKFLDPHPPDLTAPPIMKGMTRARLKISIRDGIRESSMPAWRTVLTDREIDAVITYIHRAFHELQSGEAAASAPSRQTKGR